MHWRQRTSMLLGSMRCRITSIAHSGYFLLATGAYKYPPVLSLSNQVNSLGFHFLLATICLYSFYNVTQPLRFVK